MKKYGAVLSIMTMILANRLQYVWPQDDLKNVLPSSSPISWPSFSQSLRPSSSSYKAQVNVVFFSVAGRQIENFLRDSLFLTSIHSQNLVILLYTLIICTTTFTFQSPTPSSCDYLSSQVSVANQIEKHKSGQSQGTEKYLPRSRTFKSRTAIVEHRNSWWENWYLLDWDTTSVLLSTDSWDAAISVHTSITWSDCCASCAWHTGNQSLQLSANIRLSYILHKCVQHTD